MSGYGDALRQRREEMHLSVLQAAEELKTRPECIQGLESENLTSFAAGAYARVFLRSYARLLNLDPAPLLRELGSASPPIPSRPPVREGAPRVPRGAKPIGPQPIDLDQKGPGRALFIPSLLLLAVIVVGVVLGIQWDRDSARRTANVPILAGLPTGVASPSAGRAPTGNAAALNAHGVAARSPVPAPSGPPAPVSVRVDATDRTWLEYSIDDGAAAGANLEPGQSQTFGAQTHLVLRIGNAGGVRLTYNGRGLGVPGRANQVRHLVFEKDGAEDRVYRIVNAEKRPWQPESP